MNDYNNLANLQWAIDRWNAEVKNRPMINIHRRSLDDCWRQCVKRFGGDPDKLLGPSHDELRSRITTAEWLKMGGSLGEHVNKVRYEYLRDSKRLAVDPDTKIVVCGNGGEDVLTDEQLDAAVDAEMGATGRPGFTGS